MEFSILFLDTIPLFNWQNTSLTPPPSFLRAHKVASALIAETLQWKLLFCIVIILNMDPSTLFKNRRDLQNLAEYTICLEEWDMHL